MDKTKEGFEQALINTIRKLMAQQEDFKKSEMSKMAHVETAISGNFTDPETNVEYGFTFKIGRPDFWDDQEEENDDEDNFLD